MFSDILAGISKHAEQYLLKDNFIFHFVYI